MGADRGARRLEVGEIDGDGRATDRSLERGELLERAAEGQDGRAATGEELGRGAARFPLWPR